MGNDALWLGR